MTARMDGAELRCRREYLGLASDDLAGILGVNPRTVRSWETGRDPVPERIGAELAEIEKATADQVQTLAEAENFGDPEVYVGTHCGIAGMPTRWWRHVVARAREQNPGIVIRTAQ